MRFLLILFDQSFHLKLHYHKFRISAVKKTVFCSSDSKIKRGSFAFKELFLCLNFSVTTFVKNDNNYAIPKQMTQIEEENLNICCSLN